MPTDPLPKSKVYLRYLGLAGQWMGILAASMLLGWWIDRNFATAFPWFIIILPSLMLIGSLIKVVIELGGPDKKDKTKN